MEKKCRSSFGSAPLGSAASGPGSDSFRGSAYALQSSNGDGAAEANATGSGGARLQSSSSLASAAAVASDENNAAAEEENATIGGGIFKAISDAASQEAPLQGKPFDSYAFGPPVSS